MGPIDFIQVVFEVFGAWHLTALFSNDDDQLRQPVFLGLRTDKQAKDAGPLRKPDLGNQHRLDPNTALHDCGRDPLAPAPWPFFRQINKGHVASLIFCIAPSRSAKTPFGEAGADSVGEMEPGRTVITGKAPSSFRTFVLGRCRILFAGGA